MGKGDKKTKKGKIRKGSFGVRRPHNKKRSTTGETKTGGSKKKDS